ncbi:MAG: sugar phosphate isomerase/epimerase [Minisyncoccia bacterium]
MKLSISNLAWKNEEADSVYSTLQTLGVGGIEIAPIKTFGNIDPGSEQISKFKADIGKYELAVIASQAYLFGRPDLQLFGSAAVQAEFIEYTKKAIALTAHLGGKIVVFGAPKNRRRLELQVDESDEIAKIFLAEIGAFSEKLGIIFCIEPNAVEYGCDYITDSGWAARLIRSVNSPGIGLHLDSACMAMSKENIPLQISRNADILKHFHVSEPFLKDFKNPSEFHDIVASALSNISYKNWVSIEMLGGEDAIRKVETAVIFAQKTYGKLL